MKKWITKEEALSLTRKECFAYCEKWGVPYRTKDSTKDIRNKIANFVSSKGKSSTKKKSSPKKSTSLPAVKLRQVGRTLIVSLKSKTYKRTLANANAREDLKDLVKSYNERPTKKALAQIESEFGVNAKKAVKEKSSTLTASKGTKANKNKPRVSKKKVRNISDKVAASKSTQARTKKSSSRGEY